MKDLPLPVIIIINTILFIVYWFVLNFMAGFLIGIVSLTGLYNIDNLGDSFFGYISLLMLGVTLITVYYKKSFYVTKSKIKKVESPEVDKDVNL